MLFITFMLSLGVSAISAIGWVVSVTFGFGLVVPFFWALVGSVAVAILLVAIEHFTTKR